MNKNVTENVWYVVGKEREIEREQKRNHNIIYHDITSTACHMAIY